MFLVTKRAKSSNKTVALNKMRNRRAGSGSTLLLSSTAQRADVGSK